MSDFTYIDLFTGEPIEAPVAAQNHSVTSVQAAVAIRPFVNLLQLRILEFLRDTGPATDEDMQANLQMNPNTQRPRRIELVKAGLVVEVGKHKTRSGRDAALWGLSPGAQWEEKTAS